MHDLVQNLLLQILWLVTMEPPVSFDAEDIRNKKMDVLHAIRPIRHHDVYASAARGQYGEGWGKGSMSVDTAVKTMWHRSLPPRRLRR